MLIEKRPLQEYKKTLISELSITELFTLLDNEGLCMVSREFGKDIITCVCLDDGEIFSLDSNVVVYPVKQKNPLGWDYIDRWEEDRR
ncbi:hypothetical protein [Vibrio phage RYC]|nr:hypothetical protein [Vibrio phage RYC]